MSSAPAFCVIVSPLGVISMAKGEHRGYRDRVFEAVSRVTADDGTVLFSVERAERYIEQNKRGITRANIALHDKDTYTLDDCTNPDERTDLDGAIVPYGSQPWLAEDDELRAYLAERERQKQAENPHLMRGRFGELKPVHIHFAVELKHPRSYAQIAKELGLPVQCIQKPTARLPKWMVKRGMRFDALAAYASHQDPIQQAKGKHAYDFSEMKTYGFDYAEMLDNYMNAREQNKASGMKKAEVDDLRNRVAAGELTPREIKEQYGWAFYDDHQKKFKAAYNEFIASDAFVMEGRQNVLIAPSLEFVDAGGEAGGLGKTGLAKAFANGIHPELPETRYRYHEITDMQVMWDRYEWQPVVIVDDVRGNFAQEIGVQKFLTMTDPHPGKGAYNVKFGDTIVVCSTLIYTSSKPLTVFLDGLSGEYTRRDGSVNEAEARSQVYRRFAIVVEMAPDKVEVLVNYGVWTGTETTDNVLFYVPIGRIHTDVAHLLKTYSGDALAKVLEPTLRTMLDASAALWAMQAQRESDAAKIDAADIPLLEVLSPEEGVAAIKAQRHAMAAAEVEDYKEYLRTYFLNSRWNNPELEYTGKSYPPLDYETWQAAGRPMKLVPRSSKDPIAGLWVGKSGSANTVQTLGCVHRDHSPMRLLSDMPFPDVDAMLAAYAAEAEATLDEGEE